MSLKVLIVPDKFKGTLTARKAAEAIAKGWHRARPGDSLDLLPMTDGGDGFGEVMGALAGAKVRIVKTVDAAHRTCRARWWWNAKTRTAIVESAEVIALSKHDGFHPFELDTFGLGAVLLAALKAGARRCLIGIGGSATNDGGFGVARSMGWQFLNGEDREITRWIDLDKLKKLVAPKQSHWFKELIVAVDVRNPLLGARGSTRVYGPQKGLRKNDFAHAERCLRRLAAVAKSQLKRDFAKEPGVGAAGGLGFGLSCFLDARLEPGFELFAHESGLMRRLKRADMVITGEGAIDRSTMMGKGVGQVARLCRRLKIPCVGLGGIVSPKIKGHFTVACGLTDITSETNAKKEPERWLERLAANVARSEFKL